MARVQVLVVDDENSSVQELKRRLEGRGFKHVELAASAEDASHLTGELRSDLALIDRQLLDAIETALDQKKQGWGLQERTIFEAAQDGMFVIDPLGKFHDVNPAGCSIFGYTSEEILGSDPRLLLFPEDAERMLSPNAKIWQEGAHLIEYRMRKKNGTAVWVEMTVAPLVLSGERLLLIILRDNSEKKRTQEAMRRSVAELARSNAFIAALSQVAARFETTPDPGKIMETIGTELEQLGLTCVISLPVHGKAEMVVSYTSIKSFVLDAVEKMTGLAIQGRTFPIASGSAGEEPNSKRARFHPDLTAYVQQVAPRIPPGLIERAIRMVGVGPFTPLVYLPLSVREREIGDLVVWGQGLREDDISALSIFATQVAVALEKARLFEALKRRAEETETLRDAAAIVTSALDLDQVLDRILTQLARVIPYDSAAVFLLEGDQIRITAGRGFEDLGRVVGSVFPVEDPLVEESYTMGKPIILVDAQADPRFKHWCCTTYVRGWMGVPLMARGELIGYLTLDSCQVGAYGEAQLVLAQAFASQAAIAIENARLFKQVQHLAITDPLTGMYNRRHFFEMATREFERAHRYETPLSIVMWDTDHFKQVNDTFGHLIGDQVLQVVAERCRENLREVDVLGRYGGEEFVILMPETALTAARQAAGRICNRIGGAPVIVDDRLITVTISAGVASLDSGCESLEILLDRADQALYIAKQQGRNQVFAWNG